MKIDNSSQPVTNISVNDGKRRADIAPSSNSGQAHKDTNVHISPNASQLQSTDSGIVNTARVQEIKQAISEGNFKVNPEVVADRLLETVKELIQSKKGDI